MEGIIPWTAKKFQVCNAKIHGFSIAHLPGPLNDVALSENILAHSIHWVNPMVKILTVPVKLPEIGAQFPIFRYQPHFFTVMTSAGPVKPAQEMVRSTHLGHGLKKMATPNFWGTNG